MAFWVPHFTQELSESLFLISWPRVKAWQKLSSYKLVRAEDRKCQPCGAKRRLRGFEKPFSVRKLFDTLNILFVLSKTMPLIDSKSNSSKALLSSF